MDRQYKTILKMELVQKCPLCKEIVYSELRKGCKMCGMILENETAEFCSEKCRGIYKQINGGKTSK